MVADYSPGLNEVVGGSAGVSCIAQYAGRYGRVGWACTPSLPKGLAPKHSVSFKITITAPSTGAIYETLTAAPSPLGEQLNKVSHTTKDTVSIVEPPLPGAPTGVSAKQVGDELQVIWTPAPEAAEAITRSNVTLTPTGESTAPVLHAPVRGQATSAAVAGLEPQTTYLVTVVSDDARGEGPASAPLSFTTPVSTVPPSAPTVVGARWLGEPEGEAPLIVSWKEASPGDSPVDSYEITATPGTGAEGAGIHTNTAPAPYRETEFVLPDETSWSIEVRAHNAAGWGAWSAPVMVSGLG